jgi:hypothetical protein
MHIIVFILGLGLVLGTLFSALSTFVLPRAARSQLNLLVFGSLRRMFELPLYFIRDYRRRDAIMAYYAPIGLMLLLPTWYILVSIGYAAMYWSMSEMTWSEAYKLSGSSLLTLGLFEAKSFPENLLIFSEATLGLILVALLISYLPTMYSAFSRREQAVNMLEVRAGNPPSAVEMILRYHRIHGLDSLRDYWRMWEIWFSDLEETHTVLPALVFFRSPRPENSWVIAAGAILDSASFTLAAVDIPQTAEAALCIRAGFLAFRRICEYFNIPFPSDPKYPHENISITREEFEETLDQLGARDVPVKKDRDKAWLDFAGWRVNYDSTLLALCALTMAPPGKWSSDRVLQSKLPPLSLPK